MTEFGRRLSIILMVVAIVALLCGCGGDTSEAKGQINDGDKAIAAVKSQDARLSAGVNELLSSLSDPIKQNKKPNAAAFRKSAAALTADAAAVRVAEEKAAELYRKATTLKAAGYYAQYASLKLSAAEETINGLDVLEKYLKDATAIVTAKNFDSAQFLKTTEDAGTSLQQTGQKIDALQKQAQDLRTSRKL